MPKREREREREKENKKELDDKGAFVSTYITFGYQNFLMLLFINP